MSKTFRRKNEKHEYYWVLRDWDAYWEAAYGQHRTKALQFDPKSQKGQKALAIYHSDAYLNSSHKEPGPSWYRNIFSQRPLRRDSKEQLRKFMLNEEIEVIIETKPPLPYWI